MGVSARRETAAGGDPEHLWEVQGDLLLFEGYEAETAQARSVDHETAAGERIHFIEARGVLALQMGHGAEVPTTM